MGENVGRGAWRAKVRAVGLWLAVAAGLAGCAHRHAGDPYPRDNPAPRTVIAQPGAYDDVRIQGTYRKAGDGGVLGYETLTNGEDVTVVEYVHTYPEAIDSFPQVYWADRWYYNVHGDFVYYDPYWGTWAYYYGPPAPLVACWNGYYPWAPYYWGNGYYGAGWYWGGVGVYGYHAYGMPVVHDHHHHHDAWQDAEPGGGGDAPTPDTTTAQGPQRTGTAAGGTGEDPQRKRPVMAAGNDPQRTGAGTSGAPTRTDPTSAADAGPSRSVWSSEPTRGSGRSRSYETSGGQRVTVIDPTGTRASAPTRTNSKTIRAPGGTPTFRAPPSREAFTARPSAPTRTNPSWTQSVSPRQTAPTRPRATGGASDPFRPTARPSAPVRSAPTRTSAPSRPSPSRATPTRTSPTRSAPSRTRPTRTAPSRTTPSRSAPSRSAPSRTSPSRAPTRSAPSRAAPSRAAPTRSAPVRSSPRRK